MLDKCSGCCVHASRCQGSFEPGSVWEDKWILGGGGMEVKSEGREGGEVGRGRVVREGGGGQGER